MFTYVDFSRLSGGYTAACERLPEAPAVYAFFRKIQLPSGADDFVSAILATVRQAAAPKRKSRVGPLHEVELASFSTLSDTKEKHLRQLAEDSDFREFLSLIMETSSLLQAPLYVGKAESLQSRIRQHLEPTSDLNTRLHDSNIRLTDAVLAYSVVDDPPFTLTPDVLYLIEELITRTCRPGFVSRIG